MPPSRSSSEQSLIEKRAFWKRLTAVLDEQVFAFENGFWDLIRGSRQSPGGIAAKAIAGIELALIDITPDGLLLRDVAAPSDPQWVPT